jgi:hypothetical protein
MSFGVKLYADATFVANRSTILNLPTAQISTTNQTKFGGSVSVSYPWLFK